MSGCGEGYAISQDYMSVIFIVGSVGRMNFSLNFS